MKKDLSFCSIDELCHVEYGTRVVKKRDAGTIYPVYGGGGATFFMDEFNREDQFIISRFGMSEKCTRFVEGKFFLNDSGLTLKPKDENILNQRYLDYQCMSLNDLFFSLGKGSAQKNLHVDSFKKVILAYHPLPLQKQIVEKLDAAFSDIDKGISVTEKNLENAEALFQSLLNNQFNSKENLLSLKEVAELDKKQGKYMDLPYIGMEDIESGTGKFLGDLSNKEMKSNTFKFNSDHLLYGRLRPYLNKVMLPDFEGHCSTEIFPILVKESIKKEYLFYWLISEETVKQINRTSTGARMPRANYKAIEEFKLNVPDINSQMEIVKKIKAIELKLRNYKHLNTKKISEFNLLKSSILNQAFSGELTKDAA